MYKTNTIDFRWESPVRRKDKGNIQSPLRSPVDKTTTIGKFPYIRPTFGRSSPILSSTLLTSILLPSSLDFLLLKRHYSLSVAWRGKNHCPAKCIVRVCMSVSVSWISNILIQNCTPPRPNLILHVDIPPPQALQRSLAVSPVSFFLILLRVKWCQIHSDLMSLPVIRVRSR